MGIWGVAFFVTVVSVVTLGGVAAVAFGKDISRSIFGSDDDPISRGVDNAVGYVEGAGKRAAESVTDTTGKALIRVGERLSSS